MFFIEKAHSHFHAILPTAIPINQKYCISRGKNILSKKYRAYKKTVQSIPTNFEPIPKKYRRKKLIKNISVNITLYEKDNRRDVDATIKIILDCLNGKIWEDDSQIWEIYVRQLIDREDPKVIIFAYETI